MDVGVLSIIWLLPAIVWGGVLRDIMDEDEPCRTYVAHELIHLDCSDRGLIDLPDEITSYKAQVLLLSNNNFISFPRQLDQFTQLQTLDMSGNRLSATLPPYMENFNSLKTLNLSNNNYNSWLKSENTFHFKKLDLSKNKINRIDEDAFVKTPNLSFLDLSENRITDLSATMFEQATHLDTLILSRNYFMNVPQFRSHSLRNLHLNNCQVALLSETTVTEMTSLVVLDLSINQIEYIPDNFQSKTLQELDLSYNEISVLSDRSFSLLPHLAVLDLRGNGFKEVWSTSYFASNPFLREVYVKGNRWSCEGFSVNLLLTYEFLTKEPPKVLDKASLICYTPANVTQLTWQQAYIRTWHADDSSDSGYNFMAVMIGIIIGIVLTSFVCRGLMFVNKPDPEQPTPETVILNGPVSPVLQESSGQDSVQTVNFRNFARDDLPPSYDEALLLPRLNASFHSLPDFVDEEEDYRRNRRSRSIGDLTEARPRLGDRRSIRRPVQLNTAEEETQNV